MDRAYRRAVQIVFQHPDSSLNPRQTVADILSRPLRLYGGDVSTIPSLLEESAAGRLRKAPRTSSRAAKSRGWRSRALRRPDLIICDEISAARRFSAASVVELLLQLRARTAPPTVHHHISTWCSRSPIASRHAQQRNVIFLASACAPVMHLYRELIAASPAPVG
jgi:peptide/nickel transport system ATP-binding protein